MGANTSSLSFKDSSSLVTNVIQSTTQSCITSDIGGNSILIDGNYNVLDNVTQTLSFTVNQNCSAMVEDPDNFSSAVANSIQQQLAQTSAELGSFLSGSQGDNANTSITNAVTTNITQETVQNCLMQNSFPQSITVIGNGNDLMNVTQSTVADVIMTCTLNQNGAITSAQTIADTVNQISNQAMTNPISDCIDKIFGAGIVGIVVIFVVLIVSIILYKMVNRIGGYKKLPKSQNAEESQSSQEPQSDKKTKLRDKI